MLDIEMRYYSDQKKELKIGNSMHAKLNYYTDSGLFLTLFGIDYRIEINF